MVTLHLPATNGETRRVRTLTIAQTSEGTEWGFKTLTGEHYFYVYAGPLLGPYGVFISGRDGRPPKM
jgi:hypothetical protein